MREPSSTYIFATRPGTLTASSERTGEMSSPVATIVPPDSVATPAASGVVPGLGRGELLLRQLQRGVGGVQVGDGAMDVLARGRLRIFEKEPRLLLALFGRGDARRDLAGLPDRNGEAERAISITAGRKRS